MAWGLFSSSSSSSSSSSPSSNQSSNISPPSYSPPSPSPPRSTSLQPAPPTDEPEHESNFSSPSPTSPTTISYLQPWSDQHERLNLPFPARLTVFSVVSFTGGFLLGSSIGGPAAALQYRALNAHRLPTSSAGWYLYHKSKNYHAIVGGVKMGMISGLKTTAWGISMLAVEEAFDQAKGYKDFTSSVGAGLTTAGLFSAIYHRGDIFTAARTAKIGLVGGAVYGLAQDALMWARGHPPRYVGWIRRKLGKENLDNNVKANVPLLREGGDRL